MKFKLFVFFIYVATYLNCEDFKFPMCLTKKYAKEETKVYDSSNKSYLVKILNKGDEVFIISELNEEYFKVLISDNATSTVLIEKSKLSDYMLPNIIGKLETKAVLDIYLDKNIDEKFSQTELNEFYDVVEEYILGDLKIFKTIEGLYISSNADKNYIFIDLTFRTKF